MPNAPVIANYKLMSIVLLVCIALMGTLFAYHLNQKTNQPAIDPNKGMLFTSKIELKPFELVTANFAPFTQKNLYDHWSLLFFGFTHCASICPTTLERMKQIYPELHQHYPNLQFVFISIDPERDALEKLVDYVHAYHPDFIAVSGKIQNVRKLQAQLGIYSAPDQRATPSIKPQNKNNYQILHTASIMLIGPHGEWVGVFNNGLSAKDLMQGIKQAQGDAYFG